MTAVAAAGVAEGVAEADSPAAEAAVAAVVRGSPTNWVSVLGRALREKLRALGLRSTP